MTMSYVDGEMLTFLTVSSTLPSVGNDTIIWCSRGSENIMLDKNLLPYTMYFLPFLIVVC